MSTSKQCLKKEKMVFILSKTGNTFYIIKGHHYSVGRKDNDILLKDDQSISRKHATIKVDNQNEVIILIDHSSKYGTFLNNKKITPNVEISVKENDKLRFGVFHNEFSIERIKLVTVCSGLTSPQKEEVSKILKLLGGKVAKNWDSNCTHLTNQEISLTVKVLNAIIDEKPLVNIEFWKEFVTNIKQQKPPPNFKDFQPSISELFLSDVKLQVNNQRKHIFKNKIFVFPNEKLKRRIAEIVIKCGGKCISWEENPLSLSGLNSNYIFIHSDSISDLPASLKKVFNYLRDKGQRAIPYSEIATAIINSSIEKDCNPNFDKLGNVFVKKEERIEDAERPLVFDTETQNEELVKKEIIIERTMDEDNTFQQTLLPPPSQTISSTSSRSNNPFVVNQKKRSNNDGDEEKEVQSGLKKIKLNEKSVNNKDPETKVKTNPFLVKTQTQKSATNKNNVEISTPIKREAAETSIEGPPAEKRMKVNPFVVHQNREKKPSCSGERNVFKKEIISSVSVEESVTSNVENESTSPISWFNVENVKKERGNEGDDGDLSFYRIPEENIMNTSQIRTIRLSGSSGKQPNSSQKNFKKFVKAETIKCSQRILELTSYTLGLTDDADNSKIL